mmetsp:Transcript_4931/g.21210  ORF Transcript_4931/g.21210 Transcript_4931/m.21210 type:complete len:333 (-) Transcript_4931:2824-3822(-)
MAFVSGGLVGFVREGACSVRKRRAWRRGWRSCTEDEQYDEYEGVRRLLLVAGMTGLSFAATKAWDRYGLDLIDATLNRLPDQPVVEVQMNPLNPDLENLLLDVTRDVATRKMGLFEMAALKAAADEKMAQAQSLFKESELTEIDEDTTRFNLKLYSLYHTIAVGTTSKQRRFDLTKKVARELLTNAERKSPSLAQKRSQSRASPRESKPVIDGITEILTGYREDGLISGFKIDLSSLKDIEWREDGQSNFSVFADDLRTMTAAQLLAAEEYDDTAPVFIPYVLEAFLQDCGFQVSMESFYIDNTYQSDPSKYAPHGLVATFDIQDKESIAQG